MYLAINQLVMSKFSDFEMSSNCPTYRKRIELESIFFITNHMLRSISHQANCIFTHSLAEVDGVRNK